MTSPRRLTFRQLDAAISRAYREGNSREAEELEVERNFRRTEERERAENAEMRATDLSRRSFRG